MKLSNSSVLMSIFYLDRRNRPFMGIKQIYISVFNFKIVYNERLLIFFCLCNYGIENLQWIKKVFFFNILCFVFELFNKLLNDSYRNQWFTAHFIFRSKLLKAYLFLVAIVFNENIILVYWIRIVVKYRSVIVT